MITPRFSCSQTQCSVVIRIYTPAIRASDVELHADGTLFTLHINPYLLRLEFPRSVRGGDASSVVYDPDSGHLTVSLTKANPGEDFKDLDIPAKLLATPRRDEHESRPLVEVIDAASQGYVSVLEELSPHQREVLEAAKGDWHIPQRVPDTTEHPPISLSTGARYGFLDSYSGYFRHVAYTENEVNELGGDVESLSPAERRQRRLAHENEKWDEEYYIADFMDDEYIRELICYEPPLESSCSPALVDPLAFTEQENMDMLRLPRKEYLVTSQQEHNLYLTLVTILFSYVYDARTTQNDPTPESAWTICSLTPAFSALDPPPYGPLTSNPLAYASRDLQDALVPSFRRALAFPLYRHFDLAAKCLRDAAVMLKHGRRAVLRALLETKRILEHHEVYSLYSKVWMEDFCRWIASDASEMILRSLGDSLSNVTIEKRNLGWDILALEAAARQEVLQEREPDSDDEANPGHAHPTPNAQNNLDNNDDDGASMSLVSSSASTLSSSASESESSSPSSRSASSPYESDFDSISSGRASASSDLTSSSHSSLSGP